MKTTHWYVYVDSTDEGVPFYVGKGNLARVKGYRRNLKHRNVSRKHGLNRVVHLETFDERVALDKEIALIAELHTFGSDPLCGPLACNMSTGGERGCHVPLSEESRRKMSEAARKRIQPVRTEEWKSNISAAHKGRPSHPNCHWSKDRVKVPWNKGKTTGVGGPKGKPMSNEHKLKMVQRKAEERAKRAALKEAA